MSKCPNCKKPMKFTLGTLMLLQAGGIKICDYCGFEIKQKLKATEEEIPLCYDSVDNNTESNICM